jgi:hypothetical protein
LSAERLEVEILAASHVLQCVVVAFLLQYYFLLAGDGRRLTVLLYLNPSWKKEDGGALRLFPKSIYSPVDSADAKSTVTPVDAGSAPGTLRQAVDIYPEGGRLAMFYSADVAHEVAKLCALMRYLFVMCSFRTLLRSSAVSGPCTRVT